MICPCCETDATRTRTPGEIGNRPGLPEIAYRSGRHGDFLASMLTALSAPDRLGLAELRTRDPDDPTIALLDAFATTCDVLTFYTERLANEAFLRTATERVSLAELGKLLAYRLGPGVAAETWFAFSLERPPEVPPGLPPDPGLAPPVVPEVITIPERLRVQSVPGPGEQPQTFETVEAVEARPEWNALPVVDTRPYPPAFRRPDGWLAGANLGLRPGEAILFASDDLVGDKWDLRLLTQVEPDLERDRTYVRWEWPLGSLAPVNTPAAAPEVFVLRKRLAVFGHNAPLWQTMSTTFKNSYPGGSASATQWPSFTAMTVHDGLGYVELDGSHPEVVTGSWVVVSQEDGTFYRELYRVRSRSELSRSRFGISGTVTRLVLEGEIYAFGTPRQVTVFAVAEPLTLTEAPDSSPVEPTAVVVSGDATTMAEGRTVVVAGTLAASAGAADAEVHAEVAEIRTATAQPGGRTRIELAAPLQHAFARTGTVVFGNVARATHGITVREVLGSGDARQGFQTHHLRQGPLTFVPADTATGSASTLDVQVDGLRWTERSSTLGAGPADRILTTRTEPDGRVAVVFGDGARGARPATGQDNLRATYRVGLGAAGNLRPGQLSQLLDRPLGLKAVANPVPATGGVDPEPPERARVSIPRGVRTLGRAVSLQDYADFALAFPGIAKAEAVVLALPQGRTVVVTVSDDGGAGVPASTVKRLGAALRESGDPYVQFVTVPARPATFRLALRVAVAADRETADVLAAVAERLRSRFGAEARPLGGKVHHSEVVAAAAAVPGALGVDLDRLYRTGSTAILRHRLAAQPAAPATGGQVLGAELLVLADEPFDTLVEMT